MGTPSAPRDRAIERLKSYLLRRGSPRLQMFFFLALTGLAGFLFSVLLHALGLQSMMIRYPLAVGLAYLTFLLLVGLWLASFRLRGQGRGGVAYDPWPYGVDPGPYPASRSPAPAGPPPQPQAAAKGGSSGGGGWSADLGDGEGAAVLVVVLIILAIGAAVFASFLILLEAPLLFAEVLVDGALVMGLARRARAR
jgi:hypothetical protein